jgi:hypothetical protein
MEMDFLPKRAFPAKKSPRKSMFRGGFFMLRLFIAAYYNFSC